jgi:hypothetical protein
MKKTCDIFVYRRPFSYSPSYNRKPQLLFHALYSLIQTLFLIDLQVAIVSQKINLRGWLKCYSTNNKINGINLEKEHFYGPG